MPTPQQHPAMASHPMPSPQEVDIGLVCLLLLPRSFVIAAAGKQLRHEFGLSRKPCGEAEVGCIARRLGLKAGKRSATRAHLTTLPLPALAQYTDGCYVILGQVHGERVLEGSAGAWPLPEPWWATHAVSSLTTPVRETRKMRGA
jgi:ABC-type bacteriocin/lantibiotic exporter with double-glycine peptidase domain